VRFYAVERRHGVGGVWETVDAPHAGNGVPVVVVDPFRPDRSLVFYRLTVWLAPW
jgi:hypothetical protein